MNIENLQTPHPNHIKPGMPEVHRPLLEAIDIEGLRTTFDDARERGDDQYTRAVTTHLPEVLEPIRRSLWYVEGAGPNATTTPLDTLAQTQETHCFGYALVTSQVLGRLGIHHWIGAIGKHATPIVPLRMRGTDNLYVADAMNAEYVNFIAAALRRTTIAVMRKEMDDPSHPRGAAMLNTKQLLGYERLAHGKPPSSITGEIIGEFEPERSQARLVVSTFHVPIGERALQGSARFDAAAAHGDHKRAALALREIPGLYYDIGAGAPQDHIRAVVAGLCERGHFQMAERAIEDYCQSFKRTKHPVFAELKADLLATVAMAKGCADTHAHAQTLYQLAAGRMRLEHRARKLRAKAAELAAAFKPRPITFSLGESH